MIDASPLRLHVLTRLAMWLAWRSDTKIAKRLAGFSATEAGSALDMLAAAENCDDPAVRRLFFRHAIDEARHAKQFADAARAIDPGAGRDRYAHVHATRQDLFREYGLIRFVAFVHLAEKQAAEKFALLARRFADRDDPGSERIAALFAKVLRDERFHVAYSGHLLDVWRREGRAREIRRALRSVRLAGAWQAWRRAGRRIGDLVSRGILWGLYLTVVPVFALVQRATESRAARLGGGWHPAPRSPRSLDDVRGQS